MMLPSPGKRAIRQRVGSRSFSRGQRYYERGALSTLRLVKNRLTAQCRGSAPQPYRLWVELAEDGIVDAECSCPVGSGGYCKHTAALLLAWLHEPETFRETAPLDNELGNRDKSDLVLLIRQMIARHPDLEEMVYLASPAGTDAGHVNPDVIRAQVQQAIESSEYGHADYHAAGALARELAAIMHQGDVLKEAQEWHNAAAIYAAVVQELLESYSEIYDNDGDLFTIFYAGGAHLGDCLQAIDDPEQRRAILRTLTDVVFSDIEMGGYGFADDAYTTIIEQATVEEKEQIATWVEATLAGREDQSDSNRNWSRQALGHFQLRLLGETIDDERFIELCRRSHLLQPLVERLLALDRRKEAIDVAQAAGDYDLLQLAGVFVAHGLGVDAENLLWERTAHSSDWRLEEWLKQYAASSNDWSRALRYATKQFARRPSLELYNEIRKYAEESGDWPERREKLIAGLSAAGKSSLLIRIYLQEGTVEKAFPLLETMEAYDAFSFNTGGGLVVEVAAAAEATHPHEAIRLYRQKIKDLVDARGRDKYAIAARLLKRVRSLYGQLDEQDAWDAYINSVRHQKPRLPALLDELKKAGV